MKDRSARGMETRKRDDKIFSRSDGTTCHNRYMLLHIKHTKGGFHGNASDAVGYFSSAKNYRVFHFYSG